MQSRRGPKRNEASRLAILEATRDLVESDGYDRLSLDAIARRAGVGKQTIYRWWSSKADVVMEAVLDGFIPAPELLEPAGDDIAEALHGWLSGFHEQLATPVGGALAQGLTAAAASNSEAAASLYSRFTGPMREQLRERLAAAGDLRPDADYRAAADAMIGSLIFLTLSRQPVEPGYVAGLLDVVLNGLRTRPGDDAPGA